MYGGSRGGRRLQRGVNVQEMTRRSEVMEGNASVLGSTKHSLIYIQSYANPYRWRAREESRVYKVVRARYQVAS